MARFSILVLRLIVMTFMTLATATSFAAKGVSCSGQCQYLDLKGKVASSAHETALGKDINSALNNLVHKSCVRSIGKFMIPHQVPRSTVKCVVAQLETKN